MATRPADHASWHSDEDDDDPILAAWLAFLERGMEEQPELIRPFTAAEFAGLDELLEGVEADLGAHLGDDDYVLP
ncbi:MAG TPA: type II toxin-antitoxin system PrlF family antitoxin [Longimicrobium sp.]|nr:type II toxin-antitoxin system PrlF family antitoxin [Longimicrobium sp.]